VDAVVDIAKAAGFAVSAEELQRAQSELSDEELEGVAGGVILGGLYEDDPDQERYAKIQEDERWRVGDNGEKGIYF
jgi:hypothetical protein